MSSETLPNLGLPQVAIPSPNKYVPEYWVNKPHPVFGFLELQARDGAQRGWVQFLPPQGFLLFGRDLGAAHIFVGHPSVSNQHAVAAWDVRDGKCYITDLESEHGTFVNDQVIEHSVPYELRPGARVRFGQSAHIYIFSNLPPELVDPNQEAPVSNRDRGMDVGTDVSKPPFGEGLPERFDTRSEHRPPDYDRHPPPPTPPFRGNAHPPDRDQRGPPPDIDPRGPPPERDLRGPPPDMNSRMDRRDMPAERWSPPPRRFGERRSDGPRQGPGPGRRMSPPRQGGRRPDGPGPGQGPGRDRSPPRFDGRRPEGHGRGMSPGSFNDRMRFEGPSRSPPRGGRAPYRDGQRSPPPRGRGSPRGMHGRSRTPPHRGDFR